MSAKILGGIFLCAAVAAYAQTTGPAPYGGAAVASAPVLPSTAVPAASVLGGQPSVSSGLPVGAAGLPDMMGMSPFGGPMCGGPDRQELDKITTRNMIEQQKLMERLRPISTERDESAISYGAAQEKQHLELEPQEMELQRLQLEASLVDARFKKATEPLREQSERLKLLNEIDREKLASDEIKADAEKLKVDVAMRELDLQSRKLHVESDAAEQKTVGIKTDLELREKKEEWKTQANRDPEYPLQPFQNGVLTISDRRIALDGPIVMGVADYVTERIHYFNNKDQTLPIFLVIDDSPGGSVMEGYRIVKAIETSKAPVHVVVKSFAASMAAVITTLAPHSYVYPNAIILHHQMISGAFGNMTEQAEQLQINKEWFARLADPVAKKMGISLDALVKDMYKHNSDGDWEEFGDKAVALKWVDNVVSEVRETGVIKQPGDKSDEKPKLKFGLAEETDARGDRFVRLPRLRPFDAYWIYNQGNYYR